MMRADGKSLALSLRNIYETLAISVPTVADAVRGQVDKHTCDDRLAHWGHAVVQNAGIELEVDGRENLRPGETYLVMSNHQSLYDIPVLFEVIGSNIRMITKKELFRVPVFGKALAAGGFISIDRSNRRAAIRSLAAASELLAKGTHVWIAPEGTRSRSGELLPFKKGAFYLALEAGLPILPVTLVGTRDALPAKGVRSTPGAKVKATIHPKIDPAPYAARGKKGRDELMGEVKRVMESSLVTAAHAAPPVSLWPAPSSQGAPGAGIAVLVNANAKRGGRRVAAQIARALPAASVRLTRSAQEVDAWLRVLPRPRAVLAAGGDGTAVALVNALARVFPHGEPFPAVGVLPLGTGNGWAHALGAPKLHRCLGLLVGGGHDPLPTRSCSLIDVEGTLAHFAGSGWDAMILDDYKRQLEASKGPSRHLTKSVYGYPLSHVAANDSEGRAYGNPHVVIENLGDSVFTVDGEGTPHRLPGAKRGTVLYDGGMGTASVGTCPEFGYHFRAFPFAERMPGFLSVRAYDRGALDAVASIPLLWKGTHPLRGMHDWLATHVRMTFSRDVQVQIGGDAHGMRRTIEYRAAERGVKMVDWRRLMCL